VNVIENKLKVLDLFSGIGMFSYGLEKTGLYETTAFCEWDKSCQEVLKRHWPNTEVFGDIRELEGQKESVKWCYERSYARDGLYDLYISRPVDVITGGFPCQDISNSGSKTGITGERSGMWFHMLHLINKIKPKGVIIENVSALRSRGVDTVLKGLYEVGYDAEWHCITASHLGAVHKRDRMFILAHPTSIGQQKPWRPLKPFGPTPIRNREAGIIKYALQRSALPYVCRNPASSAGRVDRLKQLGNTVYWPIVEKLGYHLYDNIKE